MNRSAFVITSPRLLVKGYNAGDATNVRVPDALVVEAVELLAGRPPVERPVRPAT
jgi:hypothetical protein